MAKFLEVVAPPRYRGVCDICKLVKGAASIDYLRGYMGDCAIQGHEPWIYDTQAPSETAGDCHSIEPA